MIYFRTHIDGDVPFLIGCIPVLRFPFPLTILFNS